MAFDRYLLKQTLLKKKKRNKIVRAVFGKITEKHYKPRSSAHLPL